MSRGKPVIYNRRISIQRINGYKTDENGDRQPNWIDLFPNIIAAVNIASGREFWASRKVNAQWDGLFKIRYSKARAAINTTMRIVYGIRIFDITTVTDPDEAHREIWIEAKEVV